MMNSKLKTTSYALGKLLLLGTMLVPCACGKNRTESGNRSEIAVAKSPELAISWEVGETYAYDFVLKSRLDSPGNPTEFSLNSKIHIMP